MASTTHLAELEITCNDVVAAWDALEPEVAQCAGLLGVPATTGDYLVGNADNQGGVAGADLRDCLARVQTPTSISVSYSVKSNASPDLRSIELRIMRHRRFKELDVQVRVDGPVDAQTLGLFERTEKTLARAIERFGG